MNGSKRLFWMLAAGPLIVLIAISVLPIVLLPSNPNQAIATLTLFWGVGSGLTGVLAWSFRAIGRRALLAMMTAGAILVLCSVIIEPFEFTPKHAALLGFKLITFVLWALIARQTLRTARSSE